MNNSDTFYTREEVMEMVFTNGQTGSFYLREAIPVEKKAKVIAAAMEQDVTEDKFFKFAARYFPEIMLPESTRRQKLWEAEFGSEGPKNTSAKWLWSPFSLKQLACLWRRAL